MKLQLLFCVLLLCSCSRLMDDSDIDPSIEETYFPSEGSWDTIAPATLGWQLDKIDVLLEALDNSGTRGFLIIKDGRIVVEHYNGKTINGQQDFDESSYWYWASAAKTLVNATVGLAQERDLLRIEDASSNYLGKGWTSLEENKEAAINIWHHLTMTTGLDDAITDNTLDPGSLLYKAEVGTRWAYHNAPYTLLESIISEATQRDFTDFFDETLASKIGMSGFWNWIGEDHVYFSTARDMARFGLLMLNAGQWNGEEVIIDQDFIGASLESSQSLNPAYGYLWWLNDTDSYMLPGSQLQFNGNLVPNAPKEMLSAIGKNGQYLMIIPSQNIVIVRMGDNPDQSLVPLGFMNDLWALLNEID